MSEFPELENLKCSTRSYVVLCTLSTCSAILACCLCACSLHDDIARSRWAPPFESTSEKLEIQFPILSQGLELRHKATPNCNGWPNVSSFWADMGPDKNWRSHPWKERTPSIWGYQWSLPHSIISYLFQYESFLPGNAKDDL